MFNRLALPKIFMEPPPFVVTGPFLYKRRPMKVILPRERKIYPKRTVDPNRINSKSPDYLSKKKKKPKKDKLPPEPKKLTVPVIDWAKSELFFKCSQTTQPLFINDEEMKEAPCFNSIDEIT
jgi:hypothetical protein